MAGSPDDPVPVPYQPWVLPSPKALSADKQTAPALSPVDPLTVLARRIQAGDESCWSDLIRGASKLLWAVIRRMLPEREWKDAFGQIWLKVFERLPKFTGVNKMGEPAGFGTYATRIAITECIDIRKKLDKIVKPAPEETLAAAGSDPHPADKGLPLDFERVFATLTPTQQRVFLLHYEDRRKFSEIATLLKRKESTVRSDYNRALTRLRHELAGYNELPRGERKCRRPRER